MQRFSSLPQLLKQDSRVIAIESPVTERLSLLQALKLQAESSGMPLYFWNPGYTCLQEVRTSDDKPGTIYLRPAQPVNSSQILEFLISQGDSGIFALEGLADDSTGLFSRQCVYQLMNAYYDLPGLTQQQHWILLADQIQLPAQLLPLVPVLNNALPDGPAVAEAVEQFCLSHPQLKSTDSAQQKLIRACLGLALAEMQNLLQRAAASATSLEQVAVEILTYKVTKLRNRGLEFMSEPDVPAGGLDLLDQLLERAASLLSPTAQAYGLSFPKGLILWGPPGTGKSLSAKHAAKKMGVPLFAADWGGLISSVPGESEANLRYLLQLVEVSSPCILYWDDFDKGFAGWNSDAAGGVQRRLTGKLLTWMQERTAPVFVMATVNRLEMLPPELTRRFDDIIFVDLPHAGGRKEIFDIHLRRYSPAFANPETADTVFTERQWHQLLREYNLCSAAEISRAIRKAAEEAFYQQRPGEITFADLLVQREKFTPAMIREEEQILAIRKLATYAQPAASPDQSKWRMPTAEMFEFLQEK